jgi:hypothetical protein
LEDYQNDEMQNMMMQHAFEHGHDNYTHSQDSSPGPETPAMHNYDRSPLQPVSTNSFHVPPTRTQRNHAHNDNNHNHHPGPHPTHHNQTNRIAPPRPLPHHQVSHRFTPPPQPQFPFVDPYAPQNGLYNPNLMMGSLMWDPATMASLNQLYAQGIHAQNFTSPIPPLYPPHTTMRHPGCYYPMMDNLPPSHDGFGHHMHQMEEQETDFCGA